MIDFANKSRQEKLEYCIEHRMWHAILCMSEPINVISPGHLAILDDEPVVREHVDRLIMPIMSRVISDNNEHIFNCLISDGHAPSEEDIGLIIQHSRLNMLRRLTSEMLTSELIQYAYDIGNANIIKCICEHHRRPPSADNISMLCASGHVEALEYVIKRYPPDPQSKKRYVKVCAYGPDETVAKCIDLVRCKIDIDDGIHTMASANNVRILRHLRTNNIICDISYLLKHDDCIKCVFELEESPDHDIIHKYMTTSPTWDIKYLKQCCHLSVAIRGADDLYLAMNNMYGISLSYEFYRCVLGKSHCLTGPSDIDIDINNITDDAAVTRAIFQYLNDPIKHLVNYLMRKPRNLIAVKQNIPAEYLRYDIWPTHLHTSVATLAAYFTEMVPATKDTYEKYRDNVSYSGYCFRDMSKGKIDMSELTAICYIRDDETMFRILNLPTTYDSLTTASIAHARHIAHYIITKLR